MQSDAEKLREWLSEILLLNQYKEHEVMTTNGETVVRYSYRQLASVGLKLLDACEKYTVMRTMGADARKALQDAVKELK